MDSNNTTLYRKQGQTQVVDALGNLQNFTGNLESLPIYKPQNNVITTDALQPQPKLELPTTPTPAPTKPAPVDYDQLFGLTDFEKQAQQTQETGLSEIIKSMGVLQNEATDLQAERQKQGLQDKYRENQATKARILSLDAEMQQDDIQLAQKLRAEERRDTLLPFAQQGQAKLAGDAAIYRALKTAEKNTLISQQLAQQGDIALAEQFAKDAVDAKYAPYKQNIENFKTLMEIIKPTLTAAENKLLKVQEMKATRAENEIKKAEEEENSIQNMLIQASIYQAPASLLNQAKDIANKGGKPSDVARLLGKYSPDYLDYKLKKAQIYKTGVEAEKADLELKQTKNAIKAAENATGVSFAMLSEKQQDTTLKLRDKYNAESKDFVTIRDSYNRVQASSQNPSAAGDLALIFNYMKILDPGSVVREGEFATAQNAAGIPERVRAQYNKAIRGERLTDTTRNDFVSRAGDLFRAQQSEQQKINDNYSFLATSANIPKEFIVRDITSAVSSEQEALDNAWKATVPNTTNSTSLLDQFIQKNSSLYGQPTN